MERKVTIGDPPINVTLAPSQRARRINLRVSRLDGRVRLSYPARLDPAQALDFARERENWLRGHLADIAAPQVITMGQSLLFQGKQVLVSEQPSRGIRLDGNHLRLGPSVGAVGVRIAAWLKEQARQKLVVASDHYASALGLPYGKITLRDTRSRWGSCTSNGDLMYSWRLVMAPPVVLQYVAAHEVAHLAEMNHSPAFWSVVAKLHPTWEADRKWLRTQGAALHQVRFK